MVVTGPGISTAISMCCLLLGVATPVAGASAVGAASEPVYEGWSGTTGWRALPAASLSAPAATWRVEIPGTAAYIVQAGVVIVAEPSSGTTVVRRIDAATGGDVWRTEVAGAGEAQLSVDAAGSMLLVAAEAADGSVSATLLGAGKGQLIWEQARFVESPFVQPSAPLAIVGNSAESFAVNAADGAVSWRADGAITVYPGSLVVHSESSAAGGGGSFGVVDAATGTPLWEHDRPPGAIATALGEVVIVAHDDEGSHDSLVGFDRATGAQLWSAAVPLIGNSGAWPLGIDGALFGGNNDPDLEGSLVAVDALTGSPRWTRPYHKPGGLAMWRSDGRQILFSRTSDGTVELIDAGSGELVVSSGDVPAGWPAFSSGILYFLASGGVEAIDMASLQRVWSVDPAVGERLVGAIAGGLVVADEGGLGDDSLVLTGLLS